MDMSSILTTQESASYERDLAAIAPLTPEQEMHLVAQLPSPSAQQQLIEGLLHTVVVLAQQYHEDHEQDHPPCVPLMELIGEGNLCLVQTVHRFDPLQGGSLRHTVEAALRTCMQQQVIAAAPPSHPLDPLDLVTTSLVAPDSGEPLMVLLRHEAWDELMQVLLQLTPRQRQVIARWCGFGGDAQSLSAIGRAFGISRTSVRQHQRRGLRTLRQAIPALRLFV